MKTIVVIVAVIASVVVGPVFADEAAELAAIQMQLNQAVAAARIAAAEAERAAKVAIIESERSTKMAEVEAERVARMAAAKTAAVQAAAAAEMKKTSYSISDVAARAANGTAEWWQDVRSRVGCAIAGVATCR